MLMSLSERYVFLANPKAASGSFEAAYGNRCEIASCNNAGAGLHPVTRRAGKHISYRMFEENFAPFFASYLPIEHFFVFGIMRDPMKRLRSLFRYLTRPQAKGGSQLPGMADFSDFVDHVVERKPIGGRIRAQPRYTFFMDSNELISLNYLIRMEDMQRSLAHLETVSGLDFSKVLTVFRHVTAASADSADRGLQRVVEAYFHRDYDLYERTDRLLREWDRSGDLDIEAALRWMTRRGNRFEMAGTLLHKLKLRLKADRQFSVEKLLAALDER